jgi:hypothetical protein
MRKVPYDDFMFAEMKYPEKHIFVSGAGGCGKSYTFCRMENFVDPFIFCPSWRLASEMKEKYGITAMCHASLIKENCSIET